MDNGGVAGVTKLCPQFMLGYLPLSSSRHRRCATERGIMLREGVIYISPDTRRPSCRTSAAAAKSPSWSARRAGCTWWARSRSASDLEERSDRNVTGWILDKGIITTTTPDGDKILFGEAFDSEMEASRRGGRRGAAQDALRLYARIAEYFPASPLAAEVALSRRRYPLADRMPPTLPPCPRPRCATPSAPPDR